jgi:hypothetical protein
MTSTSNSGLIMCMKRSSTMTSFFSTATIFPISTIRDPWGLAVLRHHRRLPSGYRYRGPGGLRQDGPGGPSHIQDRSGHRGSAGKIVIGCTSSDYEPGRAQSCFQVALSCCAWSSGFFVLSARSVWFFDSQRLGEYRQRLQEQWSQCFWGGTALGFMTQRTLMIFHWPST